MTYQITGGLYIQVHKASYQDVMITIDIDAMVIPLNGNGAVASAFV